MCQEGILRFTHVKVDVVSLADVQGLVVIITRPGAREGRGGLGWLRLHALESRNEGEPLSFR